MMTAPQPAQPTSTDQAVIEVKTSFFFLAFVLYLCKPRVAINGHESIQAWGTVAIPVPPGQYQVEAWTNYLLAPQMGRNGVVVDAAPGTVTRVHWKAPWLVFLKGSIAVTDVAALSGGAGAPAAAPAPPSAAVPSAGWHPDPSGRHEQRYFDGSTWTEHVSTAGVAGTDRPEN
jgi:hypothetical protein